MFGFLSLTQGPLVVGKYFIPTILYILFFFNVTSRKTKIQKGTEMEKKENGEMKANPSTRNNYTYRLNSEKVFRSSVTIQISGTTILSQKWYLEICNLIKYCLRIPRTILNDRYNKKGGSFKPS